MAVCPTCGETTNLVGTPVADDIEITCGECGTAWRRGAPRCRGCGGAGGVPCRQVMTRTPRGNQVAVVGQREITLCPTCDAAAVAASASTPVPEDYVSVFLFGVAPPAVRSSRPSTASGPPRATPQVSTDARSSPQREDSAPVVAGPTVPPPADRVVDPTMRQAIEAYLTDGPDGDSLIMLMLGRHVGPSRRVRDLDLLPEQRRLLEWAEQTWGARGQARRDVADAELAKVLTHWWRMGWIEQPTFFSQD